jgi:hypothetical protein
MGQVLVWMVDNTGPGQPSYTVRAYAYLPNS